MTRAEIEALLARGCATDVLVRMRLASLLGHLQYADGTEVVEVVSLPPVRRAVRVAITDVIATAESAPTACPRCVDATALATLALISDELLAQATTMQADVQVLAARIAAIRDGRPV